MHNDNLNLDIIHLILKQEASENNK